MLDAGFSTKIVFLPAKLIEENIFSISQQLSVAERLVNSFVCPATVPVMSGLHTQS